MKLGWWWLLVIPVAVLVLFEVAGDWMFRVHTVRPAPPPAIPAAETQAHTREAFARPPGPSAEPTPPEIADLLLAVGTAAKEGRSTAVVDAFDCARLHDEITQSELFAKSGLRPDPAAGPLRLRAALWDAAHDGGPGLACDRVEVRKVVRMPLGGELLVYARHRLGGWSAPYRWWLAQTPHGWKAYDVEDLRIGLRLSRQAAGQYARTTGGEVSAEVLAALKALRTAADLLGKGSVDEADAALKSARGVTLPREAFVLRCVLEGAVAAMRARVTEALEWADRADAISPGLPAVDYLRASAHAAAGQWAEAALYARKYLDQLGPDASAGRILGTALREMKQPAEAAEAFEQALQDDPTRDDLKAALADLRKLP